MKKFVVMAVILLSILLSMTLCSCNGLFALSFEEQSYIIEPEQTFTPKIKIFPKNKKYTLTSSNPTIAKVSGKEIMGIKEGVVTLTVLSGDDVATAKLYIIKDEEYTGSVPQPAPEFVRISFLIEDYVFTTPMEIQKGMSPGQPYQLKRGGYELDGWYSDKECTQKYDFSKPVNEDIAVYGKWIILEATYVFEDIDEYTCYVEELAYPTVPYTYLNLPTKTNDGKTVIGISNGAFKDKTTITEVTIPDQYQYIGEQAFQGCNKLKKVIISNNSQLTEIENNAFYECSELHEIYLPESINEIGGFAFTRCAKLDIQSLPEGLTTLEQYVFAQTATKSVNLENITLIYEGAFDKCQSLATVTNTHNVTKCYKYAFRGTKIYSNQITDSAIAYIDTILVGATNTTLIVLDEKVTLIADNTFNSDDFAELILEIPFTPPSVGEDAFHSGIAIIVNQLDYEIIRVVEPWKNYRKQLYIQFEENGFQLLRRLEAETFLYTIRKYTGDAVHLDLNDLPYNLENIRTGAFNNNFVDEEDKLKIKTLTIGKVDRISSYAISNIESLLAIIMINEKVPKLQSSMSIAKSSLAGGAVKIYTTSSLLADYKKEWSYHKDIIYDINIVNEGLTLSVIPGNEKNYVVQYFGDQSTVIIPDSVGSEAITVISQNAFRYNKSVEHLVIGRNITEIGFAALTNTNIKIIEFLSEEPPQIDAYFLYNNTGLEKIYVPKGTLNSYKEVFKSYSLSLDEFLIEAD